MKTTFLLLISLVPVLLTAQTTEQLAKKGAVEMDRGNFKEATVFLTQAIRQDSSDMLLFYMRNTCYAETGRHQEALYDLNRVIDANPEIAELYFERALLEFTALQMETQAIEDFTLAIKYSEDPELTYMALVNRAGAQQTIRDFKGARVDLERLYELDTTNIDVLNNLAIVLDDLGEQERSLEMLERAVEMAPDVEYGYVNLGFQLSKLGRCEEAVYYLTRALEINDQEARTWNNLGYAKYCMGDYPGAEKDVRQSLEIDPNNSYAYRNLALIAIAQEDNDATCKHLQKAKELHFTRYFGPEVDELLEEHCE